MKFLALPNRESPSTPLRRASAHSPLIKKNEADPDSQEMRTCAGNHEEVLRARNSRAKKPLIKALAQRPVMARWNRLAESIYKPKGTMRNYVIERS